MLQKIKELAIRAGFEYRNRDIYIVGSEISVSKELEEFAALVSDYCAFRTVTYNDIETNFGTPKNGVNIHFNS